MLPPIRYLLRLILPRLNMSDKLIKLGKRLQEFEDAVLGSKVPKLDENLPCAERRRNCAILMMYSGWDYYGMQRNAGFRTIEGDLLLALHKSGLISKDHLDNPFLIRFQRASKTDKNVSAVGQVCNAKIPFSDESPVEKINEHLPQQIRVLDVFRVTQSFSSKTACNHRTYQYILPTFAFAARDSLTRESCWQYRISAETLTHVNNMLNHFKGTHNFFNFTSRRTANDLSCRRYIMSIECGAPFLLDGDREFAVITVVGQSFMLHQIRKMIGLVIAIVSGHTTEAIFEKAFQGERLDLPKAPGLGLFLDKVDFTRYNTRFCNDGSHHPIDWNAYKEKMDVFKEEHIFRHIVQKEVEENSMQEWLEGLCKHTFDYRPDGPPTLAPRSLIEQETTRERGGAPAAVSSFKVDLPPVSTVKPSTDSAVPQPSTVNATVNPVTLP
uniref:Pseudouridylate synthase 1 homolog n=2 Tax=Schistocephalus solidus TaxID=70667 RepID=A0A0X3Q5Z4_SCHSO